MTLSDKPFHSQEPTRVEPHKDSTSKPFPQTLELGIDFITAVKSFISQAEKVEQIESMKFMGEEFYKIFLRP